MPPFTTTGTSGYGSLHNTAAPPTGPSLSPPQLHRGDSTRARSRTRASTVTALDPRTTRSRPLPQSADHTAAPELEGQSRHEDGRLATAVDQHMPGAPCPVIFLGTALWRTRTTTGLASPSEFTPAQQLPEDRSPRVSSPHAMNATHGNPPRASATPRLHLRTRGSSRHSSASLSSTPRDSLRDCRK